MNDLIKDVVKEMILDGEIRIGIIKENELYLFKSSEDSVF